ncbi:hypothetical protein T4D_9663 [Trichinella pseudospiralis]|uniref:Uncharacterized protein n=1 Tax=Trichinella pseudospiralis TaxID=6337 RepID=A0A0V1G2F6_TRIPS|nr:hypothetical protein T4D_9663 [Trichinella pseudospiralis]
MDDLSFHSGSFPLDKFQLIKLFQFTWCDMQIPSMSNAVLCYYHMGVLTAGHRYSIWRFVTNLRMTCDILLVITLISNFPRNDGPTVMSSVFREAQHIIRRQHSNAHYIV